MGVSGFTFGHNLIECGFPIIEAVNAVKPYVDEIIAVDIESTDLTPEVYQKLGCTIIKGKLMSNFKTAYCEHIHCKYDDIIFFEADEIFEDRLLKRIHELIDQQHTGYSVHRLQLEQNFQRCRWYPYPIHRVIRKGHNSYMNSPVISPPWSKIIGSEFGYMWDVSACFRDNWKPRREKAKLFWNAVRNLRVSEHFATTNTYDDEDKMLNEPQWLWKETPFAIPPILKHLMGMTKYEHWAHKWLKDE
jgi:hypothetical protein